MKMTDIFQTVQKILDGGGHIETHDPVVMANIYSGQCLTLNDRLRDSIELIERGMMAEAVEIAQQEPPLISLCEEMARLESSGWPDLCRERGWQIPVPLNRDAMERVKKCLVTERAIAPLIQSLRRANNLGNAGQCAAILREIVRIDSENVRWKDQLSSFENHRLQQLPKELERLKKEKNLNDMAKLIVELKQPWSIPVDERFIAEAESFMVHALEEEQYNRAVATIKQIASAHEAEDIDALGEAVTAFQHLEKSRYFRPDDSFKNIYERAMTWYRQKVGEFNDRKAFEETLLQINRQLSTDNAEGLNELWRSLNDLARRTGQSLPEELQKNIQRVIGEADRARRREQLRRRNRNLLLMAFALICVVSVVAFYYIRTIKADIASELDHAFNSKDLAGFTSVIDKMENSWGLIFNESYIQKERDRADELESILEQKKMDTVALIEQLERIQSLGFLESSETIEELLQKVHDNESFIGLAEKSRLAVIEHRWNEKKGLIKASEEKQLADLLQQIEDALLDPFGGLEDEDDADDAIAGRLQNIEKLFADANDLDLNLMSLSMKDRLSDAASRFNSLKSNLEGRKSQIAAINSAKSLNDYLRALKTFSTAFPNDPLTPIIEKINQNSKLYVDFITDPVIYDPDNLFWAALSEEANTLKNNLRLHKDKVVEDLKKMELTPRFVDLWECSVERPNRKPETWYFKGEPAKEYIDSILSYEGVAYVLSSDDTEPDFKSNHVIPAHVRKLEKMYHCTVIQNMIDQIIYEPGIESILGEMQKLYEEDISSLLKIYIMDFMLKEFMLLTGGENARAFQGMADDIKDFIDNSKVNWLCSANRKHKIESKKAESILKRYFKGEEIVTTSLARLNIHKIAMKRLPRWVGYVDLEFPDKLNINNGMSPNELWVARMGNENTPVVFLTMERQSKESVNFTEHGAYLPGEPLFEPYDSNRTRDVLASRVENIDIRKADLSKSDFWPSAWPVNVRSVSTSK
ncbi:hypothetical protein MTBBW1_2030023 [Desulfamplus magnetovallimortis]|uniref:Uncharacterized protein n=1 Tax=Desulfamplus magnetovallimortis TaxID=1246637 RepID=A0A1W1HBW6_9BACT|nr:hypothetical protein [Desulfamplus magnetovallimortis]SLM29933.1 hypothetical protein MTBBW1_2030023 [Desulfamplus magnetovallimortis]